MGTALLTISLLGLKLHLRRHPQDHAINGQVTRITGLNVVVWARFFGVIVLLWIPRFTAEKPSDSEEARRQLLSDCDQRLSDRQPKRLSLDALLLLAAERGHLPCVSAFIAAGANPNGPHVRTGTNVTGGVTPLMVLVASDHTDAAVKLLAAGANPNLQNESDGQTAAHIAAARGNARVIKALVEKGARFDRQLFAMGETPLHVAAKLGATESVRAICSLPERGDLAAVLDGRGYPAAYLGKTRSIRSLIEQLCGRPPARWPLGTQTRLTQIRLTRISRARQADRAKLPESWEFRFCIGDEPNCPLLFLVPLQTYRVSEDSTAAPFQSRTAMVEVASSEILHVKITGVDQTGRVLVFGEWFGRRCFEGGLLSSMLHSGPSDPSTGAPLSGVGPYDFEFAGSPDLAAIH